MCTLILLCVHLFGILCAYKYLYLGIKISSLSLLTELVHAGANQYTAQAQVHLIYFWITVVCGNAICVHSNAFRP